MEAFPPGPRWGLVGVPRAEPKPKSGHSQGPAGVTVARRILRGAANAGEKIPLAVFVFVARRRSASETEKFNPPPVPPDSLGLGKRMRV